MTASTAITTTKSTAVTAAVTTPKTTKAITTKLKPTSTASEKVSDGRGRSLFSGVKAGGYGCCC